MSSDCWRLPESEFLDVRDTGVAGKAVFARNDVANDSLVLTTSRSLSPIAHVILRPYRREVCAYCFAYDRGRQWKIRNPGAGVAFCSEACQTKFTQDVDDIGLEAHEAIEAFIKDKQRRYGGSESSCDDQDVEMGGQSGTATASASSDSTQLDVEKSWAQTESNGKMIASARSGARPSKADKNILRQALEQPVDVDLPFYLLSGVLKAYQAAARKRIASVKMDELLPSLFSLADDDQTFSSNAAIIEYTRAYIVLMAVLPTQLLSFLQTGLCRNIASRASHNAFSIRPPSSSDGEQSGEFLGWGVWPEASFFNHSCTPNVKKERRGREWRFSVEAPHGQDKVAAGTELCITYLGGDERSLSVEDRREKLHEEWNFKCNCDRCMLESEER